AVLARVYELDLSLLDGVEAVRAATEAARGASAPGVRPAVQAATGAVDQLDERLTERDAILRGVSWGGAMGLLLEGIPHFGGAGRAVPREWGARVAAAARARRSSAPGVRPAVQAGAGAVDQLGERWTGRDAILRGVS